MNKKKILSLIMALVMIVGVFSPLTAFADNANEPGMPTTPAKETTEKVTVHKILTTKSNLDFVGKKVTITPKDGKAESKVLVEKEGKYYIPTDLKNPVADTDKFVTALKANKPGEQKDGSTILIEDVKFKGQIGIDGTKYNGTQIGNLENYFGTGSKEIEGVFFALKFGAGHKGFVDAVDKKYDANTNLTNENPADITEGKYVKADPADKTKPLVLTKTVDNKPVKYLVATGNIDEAVGGKTTSTGLVLKTSDLKGEFKIDEIHDKSSYKGEAYVDKDGNELVKEVSGSTETYYKKGDATKTPVAKENVIKVGTSLTDMKAVPVEITLPLVNETGVVKEAHVYPKNIENKPRIDKNFGKNNDLKEQKKDKFDLSTETGTGKNPVVSPTTGAKYENYSKEKSLVSAEIGKEIPYEVKTEIPAQSKLATAYWTDEMTKGLTFDQKSVNITIGGKEAATTDYTLDTTENGFMLRLTEEGLKKVNNQTNAVEVVLTYTAKVNGNVEPDKTDKNKVVFNYGNNPSKGNTPQPNKPNDSGELKVTKTWDDKTWATGEKATFVLIDKETGKRVTADDLVRPQEMTDENWAKAKAEFKNEVEIGYNKNGGEYTWKYLNPQKDYKAVEVKISSGSEAEYTIPTAGEQLVPGEIKVKNHKSDNPTPLEPTSPEVVTYGKKFVKTNQDGTERLAGAKFYVKNSKDEYLVAKTSTEKDAANVDLTTAKSTLDKAIKAYNDLTAEEQKTDTEKKAAIDKAQKDYNDAFKKAAQNYKWEKDSTNAVLLVSDSQGRFEIAGLDFGDYKLEEKTPPKGFAKLNGTVDFKVFKGSYAGKDTELQYNKDDTKAGYGQQIVNKKVSIPQTGGIGTVLFTVVGIGLMAGAVMAMKKNREEA